MERYVCIHGHFYQPPRENPWLEAIEGQDSAYPYHDWNERVTAECYAPNAASRILDGAGRIVGIVNNYSKISFNFGPTLLAWMQEHSPETYEAVLAADREGQKNFAGHGPALAQAYNHMILPLANGRDKATQVIWGVRDFQHRFGRLPEGMWLPEAAVDLETLETLALYGIRFTILSPYQARRVRPPGARAWSDVSDGRIDPTRAYRLRLRSGRHLDLFFYDGPISRSIAFEGTLSKGEYLADRLVGAFSEERTWPQLVHIATDGETYGHHRPHGDMALAYALHEIESKGLARLTNYGEFLEKHPPTHEVEIFENSSWSCVHGIERRRANCGCNSGGHPGWNQEWRGPLRAALDWLRDALLPCYDERGRELFVDPWAARDEYVGVILDRSAESLNRFFGKHARHSLTDDERVAALKLLELQRHAMLMYTSCGWFFDELSGIETVQVIQYAGRALQLHEELFGDHLEQHFLERLGQAKSNIPELRDGQQLYEKLVAPTRIDLQKVGAHYAVSSLFEDYGEHARVYCYAVDRRDGKTLQSGRIRLLLGTAHIESEITFESDCFTYGVVHLGDHNISGGIRRFQGEESYQTLAKEVSDVFARGDIPELLRDVDRTFGLGTYSLKLLFRDRQRHILRLILESAVAEAEALYRRFSEDHSSLMRFLSGLAIPLPQSFKIPSEFVLNIDLRRAFESKELDLEGIHRLLEEADALGVTLDVSGLEFALRKTLNRMAEQLREGPDDVERVEALERALDLARSLPFEINLWRPQNIYYEVLQTVYPKLREELAASHEGTPDWATHFAALGEKLGVQITPPQNDTTG